jgi:hypothetical protein
MDLIQRGHGRSCLTIVSLSREKKLQTVVDSNSVARVRRLGIRHLQIDDFIMMFGMVWYTILCVALNEVTSGGGSNLMTDEDIANLTPSTHAERVRGSKWVFVSEHAFILTIWSFKSCMLVIYSRITYVTLSISLLS